MRTKTRKKPFVRGYKLPDWLKLGQSTEWYKDYLVKDELDRFMMLSEPFLFPGPYARNRKELFAEYVIFYKEGFTSETIRKLLPAKNFKQFFEYWVLYPASESTVIFCFVPSQKTLFILPLVKDIRPVEEEFFKSVGDFYDRYPDGVDFGEPDLSKMLIRNGVCYLPAGAEPGLNMLGMAYEEGSKIEFLIAEYSTYKDELGEVHHTDGKGKIWGCFFDSSNVNNGKSEGYYSPEEVTKVYQDLKQDDVQLIGMMQPPKINLFTPIEHPLKVSLYGESPSSNS